jgi:chromosome segregation ATPase
MSDASVLDYLREQFARVNTRLDGIDGDLTNLKARMSAFAAESGHLRVGMAELNSRFDRMDARIDRIERRLELVG